MKAGVYLRPGKVEIQEREIPKIKDDQVLIKVEYCGICGSDLHFFSEGSIGKSEDHRTESFRSRTGRNDRGGRQGCKRF